MPTNIQIDGAKQIGAPEDWVEELDGPCATLSVSHQVDELTGIPFLVTAWHFSEEELEQLKSGECLFFLGIAGIQHPVIKMFVHDGKDEKQSPTFGNPDGR